TQLRPAGGRIDPAQIRLAVELRQRVEECRRSRVLGQRRSDVVGQIAALRTLRRQLDDRLAADHDRRIAYPQRAHRESPPAGARRNRPAYPAAVDSAAHGMPGLGAPYLVWVERDRDNRAATRTSSDQGAKPLSSHGLIVAQRKGRPGTRPTRNDQT